MSTDSPALVRFFLLGKGFARFSCNVSPVCGEMHVRSSSEPAWVLAGLMGLADVERDIASGRLVEFSPASLLASVSSPAKSAASRLNGFKGGRPRKSVCPG